MGGITRIYLSIDGPKGPEDVQIGFSIEALVQNYCVNHSLELKLLRPKVNLGLSLAVLTALDWFFAQEKSGLVIEDDLYFQSDFVTYCQQALIEFELDKEVWLISGNRFDNYIVRGASNSWSTYPMIWGGPLGQADGQKLRMLLPLRLFRTKLLQSSKSESIGEPGFGESIQEF
jgi:hypothetical protein